MKVYHDKEKTKEIEKKIFDEWGRREKKWAEKGYNVSDCTYCEMKCYLRRTGEKQKITKRNIGFLVFGIIAEQIVMAIYPKEQKQFEANLNETVWGHLDVFEKFEFPLEGKATAKRIFKRGQLPVNWVMQLINYITMTSSKKGWLVILNIFSRQISAWCVELTEEEKLMQIEVLMDKVSRFDYAIKNEDYSNLQISPKEYGLCSFKHVCPRKSECKAKSKENNQNGS